MMRIQMTIVFVFAAFLAINAAPAPADENTIVPEEIALTDLPVLTQQSTSHGTASSLPACSESLMTTEGKKGATFACQETYADSHKITYYVTVPSHCTAAAKCGVVVNTHGLHMNHGAMEHATGVTAEALGGRKYIVVGPEDGNANWAFSFVDTKQVPASLKGTFTKGNDDGHIVSFTKKVLDVYKDVADPKHVHAMGYSQGSIMTWALMCKASELFCSAAGVAMAPTAELYYPFTSPGTYVPGMPTCWNAAMGGKGPAVERSVMLQLGKYDFYFQKQAANTFEKAVKSVKDVYKMSDITGTKVSAGPGVDWTRYTKPSGVVFEAAQYSFMGGNLYGHCVPTKGATSSVGARCGPAPWWAGGQPSAYSFGTKALDFFDVHKC